MGGGILDISNTSLIFWEIVTIAISFLLWRTSTRQSGTNRRATFIEQAIMMRSIPEEAPRLLEDYRLQIGSREEAARSALRLKKRATTRERAKKEAPRESERSCIGPARRYSEAGVGLGGAPGVAGMATVLRAILGRSKTAPSRASELRASRNSRTRLPGRAPGTTVALSAYHLLALFEAAREREAIEEPWRISKSRGCSQRAMTQEFFYGNPLPEHRSVGQ